MTHLLEDATPKDLLYPQGPSVHPGGNDAASYVYQPSQNCSEICLQVLNQKVAKKHMLFSTDIIHSLSKHSGDSGAEFREDYSG